MTKKEEAQLKREEKLKAEKLRTEQMKSYERNAPGTLICGIDEAGRGPFAGPVVAGAVILDLDDPCREILYLNDSKKLSENKRELLFREILSKAVAVGIGYSGAAIIDQINILQATYRAMRMAVGNLTEVSCLTETDDALQEPDTHELVRRLIRYELPDAGSCEYPVTLDHRIVVPDHILADAVHIPDLDISQEGIIKGDAKSISIAAGSIVAKVTRDHIMYEYDKRYPEYGFASHKGYGTAAHIAAIKEYGMLDIHRRSFIHF